MVSRGVSAATLVILVTRISAGGIEQFIPSVSGTFDSQVPIYYHGREGTRNDAEWS